MKRKLQLPTMMLILLFSADAATAVGLPGGTPADTAGYTNTDIFLLVSYILLALVFSFLCSVAEAVLLSLSLIHI